MKTGQAIEPFLVGFSESDGVRIFVLNGELDISNHTEIGKQFESEYASKQSWVFDLRDVRYIESVPIKSIFNCCKMVRDNSGAIGVVCKHGSIVERVFTAIHFGSVFPVFYDISTALDQTKKDAT